MDDFDAGTFEQEFRSPDGQELWSVLNRVDVVARMETASELGRPALAAVEDILLGEMGAVILVDRFKQMAGRMVKQILEDRGFEHAASGIRLNSVPFYKASRYRRRNRPGLYLFRSSSAFRDICLTDTRDGAKLPRLEQGRWTYVNTIDSPLKASVGYGFDIGKAVSTVGQQGYCRHTIPRVTQAV